MDTNLFYNADDKFKIYMAELMRTVNKKTILSDFSNYINELEAIQSKTAAEDVFNYLKATERSMDSLYEHVNNYIVNYSIDETNSKKLKDDLKGISRCLNNLQSYFYKMKEGI